MAHKKRLYRVEVQIAATAYIKATSAASALGIAKTLKHSSPIILDSDGDVEISGLQYDDPEMPDLSLSPAMTIMGVFPDSTAERVDD